MLHTGIWNIPMQSCTYPWSLRLPPCSLPEWWLHPWSLRLLPVQFTRAFVISSAPAPPGSWPGWFSKCWCLCVPPVRSFRPQCRDGFNMTLQVSSVMLCCVVLTLACPEIVPFALPCCLSYICFGARCAWSNRLCVEFSVVSCFRLPTSFADNSKYEGTKGGWGWSNRRYQSQIK